MQSDLQPLDDVIKTFLKICVDYDNCASNTKYCIQMMLRELQETPRGQLFLQCQTLEELWYDKKSFRSTISISNTLNL